MTMKKTVLILLGAGKRCRSIIDVLTYSDKYYVRTIIDSDKDKVGSDIKGIRISHIDTLDVQDECFICITIADRKAYTYYYHLLNKLKSVSKERIIDYEKLFVRIYSEHLNGELLHYVYDEPDYYDKWVLLDCSIGLGRGGVEERTKRLCESLIKEGREKVSIVSNSNIKETGVPTNIVDHIIRVDFEHGNKYSINALDCVSKIIAEKRYCYVVTCCVDELMIAASALKLLQPDMIHIIAVISNCTEDIIDEHMLYSDYVDMFVGVSEDIACELRKRGISDSHIKVMHVPFECKKDNDRLYSDNGTPLRIGYAGRLVVHQKRIDLLYLLIEELENKDVYYRMEIAGEGEETYRLQEFVIERGIEDKVRLLGWIEKENIPSFWERQDVAINLSDFEGRSISVVEAMGNGAVPIVTDTSGVREDIQDGINGFVVPVGDYKKMANYIELVSKRRDKLLSMGQKAHDAVYKKSSYSKNTDFWVQLFDEVG